MTAYPTLHRPRRAGKEPQAMTTPTEADRARALELHRASPGDDILTALTKAVATIRAEQREADARRIRELEEALYNNIPWHPAIRAQDGESCGE